MPEELKPCPNPFGVYSHDVTTYHTGYDWNTKCHCGVQSGGRATREQSIAAWNTRPSDAVLEAAQKVAEEIREIVNDHNSGKYSTPGGLEHLGDVWRLLYRWNTELAALLPPSAPVQPPTKEDILHGASDLDQRDVADDLLHSPGDESNAMGAAVRRGSHRRNGKADSAHDRPEGRCQAAHGRG